MLSTTGFGAIIHISDPKTFLLLAMLLRFVAGFAAGGVCTLICSLLPVFYPDSVIEKFAYFEITFSCSTIGGTCLGALLFKYVGYQWPFYILAMFCLLVGYFLSLLSLDSPPSSSSQTCPPLCILPRPKK